MCGFGGALGRYPVGIEAVMLWRERGYPLSAETSLAEQSRQGFNTTDVPLEFCLLQG
jgi:hypothetical protein